jgi:hypothetical protein
MKRICLWLIAYCLLAIACSAQELPSATFASRRNTPHDEKILVLTDFLFSNADAATSVGFGAGHGRSGHCDLELNSAFYGVHPGATRYFVQMNVQTAGLNIGAHFLRSLAARSKHPFWLRLAQTLPLAEAGSHAAGIAQTVKSCS